VISEGRKGAFGSVKDGGEVGAGLAQRSDFVGLERRVDVDVKVRVNDCAYFGFRVAIGPSLKILFRQAMLKGYVKGKVGLRVVGLEGKAALFAMDVAFNVQVIELGHAE
jgi:hypothetical protein